jgi:hypothetical protein
MRDRLATRGTIDGLVVAGGKAERERGGAKGKGDTAEAGHRRDSLGK